MCLRKNNVTVGNWKHPSDPPVAFCWQVWNPEQHWHPGKLPLLASALLKRGEEKFMTDKFIHTFENTKFIVRKSVSWTLRMELHVPQGLIPQQTIVYDLFINDLGNGFKFGEDTKLGGIFYTREHHASIQRHLSKLKAWADRELMKFSNGNCMQGE